MFDFFKKIFQEKSEGGWLSDSPTMQANQPDLLTINPEKSGLPYQVATCQSVGKERTHNEDTLFVVNTYLDRDRPRFGFRRLYRGGWDGRSPKW